MPNYEAYANAIRQSQQVSLFIALFGLALLSPIPFLNRRASQVWVMAAWYLSLAALAAFYIFGRTPA
jgi:hypothetical protein